MTGIRATYDMFQGPNAAAMLAVFQGYANEGIILSDVKFVRQHGTDERTLILGYAKASQSKVTQQGNPNQRGPQNDRMYEMPRHELHITVKGDYLDTELLISKLALLRD